MAGFLLVPSRRIGLPRNQRPVSPSVTCRIQHLQCFRHLRKPHTRTGRFPRYLQCFLAVTCRIHRWARCFRHLLKARMAHMPQESIHAGTVITSTPTPSVHAEHPCRGFRGFWGFRGLGGVGGLGVEGFGGLGIWGCSGFRGFGDLGVGVVWGLTGLGFGGFGF